MAEQTQLQFEFKITTGDQVEAVSTKPGDIVAWELRHKATFLTGEVSLSQMLWVAWRALYREGRTSVAKFDNWYDTIDGFEIVQQPEEEEADPTQADTRPVE